MNRQKTAQSEIDESPAGVVDFNERNWLPRHSRGDLLAFGELLQAYRALVFTLLCRYGIEAHSRDDLFQDVFFKVHQAAASYRPSEPLRPWLVSIVLNTVRNFRRDLGRRQHFMNHLEAISSAPNVTSEAVPRHSPGVDEQVEQQSTLAWLEQRIATLPDHQRDVLVLSTIKGLQMKEVAAILRLPENTVKTHLRRARLALAEGLAARNDPGQPITAAAGEHA